MRASVVTGVDTAPVLEPAEHVLDLVALSVKCPFVRIAILRLDSDEM